MLRGVVVVVRIGGGHVFRRVVPWLLVEGNDYAQRESKVD